MVPPILIWSPLYLSPYPGPLTFEGAAEEFTSEDGGTGEGEECTVRPRRLETDPTRLIVKGAFTN